jgi:hypothetical protein
MSDRRRRVVAVLLVLGFAAAAAGCAAAWARRSAAPAGGDEWVSVLFRQPDTDPVDLLDALAGTESAAIAALDATGAGMIDGNEIGQGEYELFFVGPDRHRLWEVLRPVFDGAPVARHSATLRKGLDDSDPELVLNR